MSKSAVRLGLIAAGVILGVGLWLGASDQGTPPEAGSGGSSATEHDGARPQSLRPPAREVARVLVLGEGRTPLVGVALRVSPSSGVSESIRVSDGQGVATFPCGAQRTSFDVEPVPESEWESDAPVLASCGAEREVVVRRKCRLTVEVLPEGGSTPDLEGGDLAVSLRRTSYDDDGATEARSSPTRCPGEVQFKVTPWETYAVWLGDRTTQAKSLRMAPGNNYVRLVRRRTSARSVQVVSVPTGLPIPGARVLVDGRPPLVTDASGALTISDLPAGEPIRVQVVAPAHAKAHFMLSAARTRHTIHVPSGLLLQGVVVDEAGAPQSGLAVGARGATDRPSGRDGVVLATETSHVTTAPDGSFAFEGMAPGDYVLGLDDETVTAPVVVTVVPDRVAEAVRLVKSSRPSRLFHLMDDEDTPVPVGTRVTVDFPERNPPGISGPFAASRSVRLGEQGSFRASARVGERLEVTLRSMNSVVTAEGRVAEGPVTVLRLRPRRSATEEEVVLLVVAPDGSPIAGARATVRTPGNAAIPRTFLADADGSLPLVVTANSEVYVSGPANGRERFQSVRFSSDTLRGDTDGRRVVLRSQGGFRIVAPDGACLAYALVTLRSSDGTTRLAVTDEFGEFVPLGAVEGEVTMVAIGLVRAYAMEPIYEVRDFSLESIVRLPPQGTLTLHASSVGNQGNVELEFVDAAGTPVTGASVYLDAGAGVGAVLLGSRERDGVVVLEGLPCRPFRFSVRVPGMTCDPSSTEIVPGGPRVVVVCRGR